MIKSKFILFITLTLSLALHAQKIEDPLPLTKGQIQKEQWVIQDKEKNLILQCIRPSKCMFHNIM